eukprot:gene31522-42028_t
MDLLANRETIVNTGPNTQVLITPAIDDQGNTALPLTPALIQHATLPSPTITPAPPRTAQIPIPPAANLRRRGTRDRTQQVFYKPHDIRLVSAQIRQIMDGLNPPPAIFPTDNDDTEPTDTDIMREYAIDTLFASEYHTGDTEEIETVDALKAPDRAQFITAIRKEITSLTTETRTLIPITRSLHGYIENTTNRRPHIAEVCGLDPQQEYRIANALYGLPDSGRIFYLHYKTALIAEGYIMSKFDHCLFYRTSPTETTYIIVYVDDTFIFSNTQANIDQVITSVGRHYEVTLDRDASSFLGLSLAHNPDGTVTITQPKLLKKLFALYPPRTTTKSAGTPTHPYPPLPRDSDPTPTPTDTYAYLRLLGILLYLTKSRPDIMAAVSFA